MNPYLTQVVDKDLRRYAEIYAIFKRDNLVEGGTLLVEQEDTGASKGQKAALVVLQDAHRVVVVVVDEVVLKCGTSLFKTIYAFLCGQPNISVVVYVDVVDSVYGNRIWVCRAGIVKVVCSVKTEHTIIGNHIEESRLVFNNLLYSNILHSVDNPDAVIWGVDFTLVNTRNE